MHDIGVSCSTESSTRLEWHATETVLLELPGTCWQVKEPRVDDFVELAARRSVPLVAGVGRLADRMERLADRMVAEVGWVGRLERVLDQGNFDFGILIHMKLLEELKPRKACIVPLRQELEAYCNADWVFHRLMGLQMVVFATQILDFVEIELLLAHFPTLTLVQGLLGTLVALHTLLDALLGVLGLQGEVELEPRARDMLVLHRVLLGWVPEFQVGLDSLVVVL